MSEQSKQPTNEKSIIAQEIRNLLRTKSNADISLTELTAILKSKGLSETDLLKPDSLTIEINKIKASEPTNENESAKILEAKDAEKGKASAYDKHVEKAKDGEPKPNNNTSVESILSGGPNNLGNDHTGGRH
jgi:hypothetical protein